MKVIFDIEKIECTLVEENIEDSFSMVLNFSFVENGKTGVDLKNTTFGFSIFKDKEKIFEEIFPKEGFVYEWTDQEVTEKCIVNNLVPDTIYMINVWCKNYGNKIQATFPIIRPRPPKPIFDSWVYDEETYSWNPPAPWPDPNTPGIAKWDEENLQWIFVDSVEEL